MTKITPVQRNMLYQIGTIRSLLTGVYEGDISFEELAHYGDFGLGTFDAVNGEMIAHEGHFYRIDADGNAHMVKPGMKTPFAVVTHFRGAESYELGAVNDLQSLQQHIADKFESKNLIYALRINGDFAQVDLRSEHPQPPGHRPLGETISQLQEAFTFKEVQGTMIGFWFPEYMKTINVPGFHFHFLDAAHKVGGHLFNMQLQQGTLEVLALFDFGMHLIHTPLFEHVNLDTESDADLKKVEKEP
jgi:acetolactate decarboxylase